MCTEEKQLPFLYLGALRLFKKVLHVSNVTFRGVCYVHIKFMFNLI